MSLRRALGFSFAGKYTSMVMEFVSVMVISRLLSPAEIGVYSLAAGTIVIGQMLRDFGLSLYLVQEKELTDEKIQSCFTISIILCWSLAAIYFFSAGAISRFINHAEVEFLVQILSINFLLIPFGTFTLSLLRREMKFGNLMFIDVSTTAMRVGVAITLAVAGYGVLSLAYASLAGAAVTVLLSFFYTQRKHYRFNFSNIKEIAKFSSFVSGTNIINQLKDTIPEIIIGRNISADAVAYFSKAAATIGLFSKLITSALAPVIQPYIAKINRDNEKLDYPIYFITNAMLAFNWPFCVFIFLFADDVLLLLYGDQWGDAVPILRVFALLSFLHGFCPLWPDFLNSIGRVKFVFQLMLTEAVIRILLVVLFIDYGLVTVALTFAIIPFIKIALLLPKMVSCFGLQYLKLLKMYSINLAISLVLLVVFWTFKHYVNLGLSLFLSTIVYSLLFGLAWFVLLYISNHAVIDKVLQTLKLDKLRRKKSVGF
jgi:O-antigen/teichoic acid export membrane protein